MTSSMDPAAQDRLGLGTCGSRVRGGGFLRRADCAGRDSEDELCSRTALRGHGLQEGAALKPGRWNTRSSGSLCGKERERGASALNGAFPPVLCQRWCEDQGQKPGTPLSFPLEDSNHVNTNANWLEG